MATVLRPARIESRITYEYLSTEIQQIRLMKVTSPLCSKDISCEVKVFDLESVPEYKALSYVWGEEDYRTITINGQVHSIRVNLHEFLKVFCSWDHSASTWLWVDQICIDQSSKRERNHQVSMMDEIYRGASETYMWLGPDSYNGVAFTTIAKINSLCTVVRDRDQGMSAWWSQIHKLQKRGEISRERHWVVQEMLLSRDPTVVHGKHMLPWMDMKNLMFMSTELEEWLRIRTSAEASESSSRYLETLGILLDERDNKADGIPDTDVEVLRWNRCIYLAKFTQCADPRDKIYGIQSLFEPRLKICVDYTLCPEDVFYQAASVYIRNFLSSSGVLLKVLAQLAEGMGFVVAEDFYESLDIYLLAHDEELPGSCGTTDEAEAHVEGILRQHIDTTSGRSSNTVVG